MEKFGTAKSSEFRLQAGLCSQSRLEEERSHKCGTHKPPARSAVFRSDPIFTYRRQQRKRPDYKAEPFVLPRRLRYAFAMLAIRLADFIDRAAIEALVHEAYAVYVPRIGRPPAPMLEDYGALIGNGRVHVLEDETGIAGIVVLIPEEHAMLLDNVAVKVAAQGRGYGRMLIAFAEAMACAAGYRTIRLFTNERMTTARAHLA